MAEFRKIRIDISVSDEEYRFLKWLAEYDNMSDNTRKWNVRTELAQLAQLQLGETMDAYNEFYKDDMEEE